MSARTATVSGGGKKVRQSGIELLRILAMLAIILHHILLYTGVSLSSDGEMSGRQALFSGLSGFGKVGVGIFFMITGYFLCKRTSAPQPRRVWPIVRQTAFYTAVGFVLTMIFARNLIDFEFPPNGVLLGFLDICNGYYWFIGSYILLMILSPQIKKMLDHLTDRELVRMTLILALLASVGTDLWRLLRLGDNGIVSTFYLPTAVIYCLIGYTVCRLEKYIANRGWAAFALLLGVVLIMMSPWVTNYYATMGWGNLPDLFRREQATGTMLVSIGSFIIFMKMKWRSRVVNYVASWTLASYLIHNNPFALYMTVWASGNAVRLITILYYSSLPKAFVVLAAFTLGIFLICGAIESVRRLVVRAIMKVSNL